ncbi:hypothetical protein GYMLUDRAFT_199964, partial [Collybiopsis luxurians FD-317 M1]
MHSSQHNADRNRHLPHHISTISTPVSVSLSPTPTSSRVYTFPTPNLLASVHPLYLLLFRIENDPTGSVCHWLTHQSDSNARDWSGLNISLRKANISGCIGPLPVVA